MKSDKRIEVGKATNLHFSKGANGAVPHVSPAVGVASASRVPTEHRASGGPSPRAPWAAAAIAVLVLAALVAAFGYWFFWRPIQVSVNGKTEQVAIGQKLGPYLKKLDYAGAQPGRLLSLSGGVVREDGGKRATVRVNGKQVAFEEWDGREIAEGDAIEVENGEDVTEKHTEEVVSMAPALVREGTGSIQYVSQWGAAGKKKVWHGKESGETIDKEVVEEPKNMVVSSRTPHPSDGKKYMALTFDDGPSSYTKDILRILGEKGVPATFFNLGNQASSHAEEEKALLKDKHELASHTNNHKNLPTCDRETLRAEINDAADAIEKASGTRPQMIRAPYGAFGDAEWARAGDLISCNVLWNIDTLDWKRPGAAAIVNAVTSHAFNGAIALMHDGGGNRQQDIEALPQIIDELQARGYQLVTVAELMRLDGGFPQDVVEGTVKMPEDAVLPEM